MSPSKFYDHDQQVVKRDINATRPSPLKIKKDSHLIQKSSSSFVASSNSSSSTKQNLPAAAAAAPPPPQQRHPVIIYTHSPKVIHTKPHDFMRLVQKLTGLSHSDDEDAQTQSSRHSSSSDGNSNNNKKMKNVGMGGVGHDDTSSSSVITDDNSAGSASGGALDTQVNSSSVVSTTFDPPSSYFSDIPLFTPNASDFFCSSRPYYRYPDPVFVAPTNMNNALSPSVLELLKGFPDLCN